MKYRNIFGTAVLTAFLPAIASAATVAIVDTTDGSGSITEALTPGYSTTLDIVDSGGVV